MDIVRRRNRNYLEEILHREYPNYSPILAMARMANDENIDYDMRFKCHKEIASYLYPKLKSIENVNKEDTENRKTLQEVLQERQQKCLDVSYEEVK